MEPLNNIEISSEKLFSGHIPGYIDLITGICIIFLFASPFLSFSQTFRLSEVEHATLNEEWDKVRSLIHILPEIDRSSVEWQAYAYATLAQQDYPASLNAFMKLSEFESYEYKMLETRLKMMHEHSINNPTSTLLLADALARQGNRKEALSLLNRVTGKESSSIMSFYLKGTLLALEGDFNGALFSFQEALNKDPNFIEAKVSIANVHLREGAVSSALEIYNDVLENNGLGYELADKDLTATESRKNIGDFLKYINNVKENERINIKRMLIMGVFNSPDDARQAVDENYADPWGNLYTEILASSPDGIRLFDVIRASVITLGVPIHGAQISGSVNLKSKYTVDQLDLHSQGVDTGLNLLTLGILKAKTINIYAPPGGAARDYAFSEKLQNAIAGTDEVNIYMSSEDWVTKNIFNMNLQLGGLVNSGVVGIQSGWRFGYGGPKINVWVFHNKDGQDKTESRNENLTIHNSYNMPAKNVHQRSGIWQNINYLTKKIGNLAGNIQIYKATYTVIPASTTNWLNDEWEKVKDIGKWVLVGRKGDPKSMYIPVLLTTEETPEEIAAEVFDRNEREHPEQKGIILLYGDPNAKNNQEIIASLKKKGYREEDIFSVKDGDLYFSDGRLSQKGQGVVSEEAQQDPIIAMGMWGYDLRRGYSRPVYAVYDGDAPNVGPYLPDGEGDGEDPESEYEVEEPEEVWKSSSQHHYFKTSRNSNGSNRNEDGPDEEEPPPPDKSPFPPDEEPPPPDKSPLPPDKEPPPPQPNGEPPSPLKNINSFDRSRKGVYTVDDNNLRIIPADIAGTGFIFGEENIPDKHVTSNNDPIHVPFLLFPKIN